MFEKLKRFFKGDKPPPVQRIEDPTLGPLIWSSEDEAWLTPDGSGFRIQISGLPQPDALLVRHAADILREKETFTARVHHFLSDESKRPDLEAFRDEIAGLKIDRVILVRPVRPDDGMIYFEGGDDYRLWRCDYLNRIPKDLGFDS